MTRSGLALSCTLIHLDGPEKRFSTVLFSITVILGCGLVTGFSEYRKAPGASSLERLRRLRAQGLASCQRQERFLIPLSTSPVTSKDCLYHDNGSKAQRCQALLLEMLQRPPKRVVVRDGGEGAHLFGRPLVLVNRLRSFTELPTRNGRKCMSSSLVK